MNYYKLLNKRVSILESYILEGKRDFEVLKDFLGDDYYDKYLSIKNKISDNEYKDIYKLIKKDPNDVKDYIDNFQSNRYKRTSYKEIGARKVYEDSDWIVYHITDYNAAKYYGRDTKWCISGNYKGLPNGKYEFDKYNAHSKIYFYINKHTAREKYAVLKDRNTGNIANIKDSKDYDLGKSLSFTDVDLPYVKEVGLNTKQQEDLFDAIRTSEGYVEDIEEYVNKDTVNAINTNGNTPLMVAVGRSKLSTGIAEFLIKNGADVNAKNNYNSTPLTIACESGNINMVKLLVKYGADVNNPMTEYGSGPLLAADSDEIEEFLIEHGAKMN